MLSNLNHSRAIIARAFISWPCILQRVRCHDYTLAAYLFAINIHAGFIAHDPQRITVESLKKETGVTDHQLNQSCTEEHLKKIAPHVENYTKFASKLNLPKGVQAGIRVDLNSSYIQRTEAVFLWWCRNIQNATYLSFVQVCLDPTVSEGDVARKMCKLCQQVRLVSLLVDLLLF